ncbi:MAG: transcriptional regulator [Propionibacteriaceae bacterium]|jgi:DNA-binding transcriptional regulator LsrR (DeoR family)|nr:transcriptional regulator [Propionibacteriaceae bacterium]
MPDRYDEMYQAASRYYIQGETMESIAHQLKLSRSSVSRLLKVAREIGLVRISLADWVGSHSPLAATLGDAFNIRVHMVAIRDAANENLRFEQVAKLAGQLLTESVGDHQFIGVAWGVTTARVVRHVSRRPLVGSVVLQINGGANAHSFGIPYIGEILQTLGDAFDSQVIHFPVPAFFDYAATREAMWRERSVQHVLGLRERLDLAVFGVGSFYATVASHVYSAGYLSAAEIDSLAADGVVGDVCTVLLREDGSHADVACNERSTGLTPPELRKIPRRLCVVADPARAAATLGALRAGVVTDLVCDESTARAVADRAGL